MLAPVAATMIVVLTTALVGACSTPVPPAESGVADTPDVVATTVSAELERLHHEHEVPGAAVAVLTGEQTRLFFAGTLGTGDDRPVDADTLFEVGSVSKIYAALLATTAQRDAKLALTDHPGRYLTWLRGSAIDEATLEQLGSYTAGGLPLQFPPDVTDEDSIRSYFTTWQPTTELGKARRYSNPSIGLLGLSAASAYGTNYERALQDHVLTPMGLRETFVTVPAPESETRYSWGRTDSSTRVRVSPGPLDAEAYGIKTTVGDLAKFTTAFLHPALPRALGDTVRPRYAVEPMRQGLGWESVGGPVSLETLLAANSDAISGESRTISPAAGENCFLNKTGSTNGFGAYVLAHPASRSGVIVLTNRNIPIPSRVATAFRIFKAAVPSGSCAP